MASRKPDARTRIRGSARERTEGHAQGRRTSDQISADLADFRKAGGQVEVLGVTRVLTKIREDADTRKEPPAA